MNTVVEKLVQMHAASAYLTITKRAAGRSITIQIPRFFYEEYTGFYLDMIKSVAIVCFTLAYLFQVNAIQVR